MIHNKKILILGSFFLLVLFGALMFVFRQSNSTNLPNLTNSPTVIQPTVAPTLIPHPTLGSMTMLTKTGVKRFPNNQEFTLIIAASSEGKNIVGYDAILSFDKTALTYVKTTSMMSDFNVFSYERPTYISISAIKSLQNNKATPWVNQSLLEVVFKPKKVGTYTFLLSPEGKETSKLVDDKAEVVYPQTDKLELEIY